MSLQFLHIRDIQSKYSGRGGVTYVVEVDHDTLKTCKIGETISTCIGLARCSPKDCFNKKTGRNLAVSRLKNIDLRVTAVHKYLNVETDRIRTRVVLESDSVLIILNQSSEDSKFRLFAVETA